MNEQESKLESIKRSCKTAIKVSTIISRILVAIVAILFVLGCGVIGAQEPINNQLAKVDNIEKHIMTTERMNLGVISWDYEDIFINGNYALGIGFILFGSAIVVLITFFIVRAVRKIFETIMASESPFTDEVLRMIKKTFIIVTIFVLITVGQLPAVFFAFFFWSLYTIFQYGKVLQKQADETL